jgi:hypothetical protein
VTQPSPSDNGVDRAERVEHRWATVSVVILVLLVAMATFAALHQGAMPQSRVETVDPRTLHLGGEFIESNLGSALEPDGSCESTSRARTARAGASAMGPLPRDIRFCSATDGSGALGLRGDRHQDHDRIAKEGSPRMGTPALVISFKMRPRSQAFTSRPSTGTARAGVWPWSALLRITFSPGLTVRISFAPAVSLNCL